MNKYAKRLVAALRSGEYKQTQGRLRRRDRFCCLGVACDIVKDEIAAVWKDTRDGKRFCMPQEKIASKTALPNMVRKLYGFRTDDGVFREKDGKYNALTGLNDTGSSFSEIADIIESEPEGLFE